MSLAFCCIRLVLRFIVRAVFRKTQHHISSCSYDAVQGIVIHEILPFPESANITHHGEGVIDHIRKFLWHELRSVPPGHNGRNTAASLVTSVAASTQLQDLDHQPRCTFPIFVHTGRFIHCFVGVEKI